MRWKQIYKLRKADGQIGFQTHQGTFACIAITFSSFFSQLYPGWNCDGTNLEHTLQYLIPGISFIQVKGNISC